MNWAAFAAGFGVWLALQLAGVYAGLPALTVTALVAVALEPKRP